MRVETEAACAMFYIGRVGMQRGMPNWIETYEVTDQAWSRPMAMAMAMAYEM